MFIWKGSINIQLLAFTLTVYELGLYNLESSFIQANLISLHTLAALMGTCASAGSYRKYRTQGGTWLSSQFEKCNQRDKGGLLLKDTRDARQPQVSVSRLLSAPRAHPLLLSSRIQQLQQLLEDTTSSSSSDSDSSSSSSASSDHHRRRRSSSKKQKKRKEKKKKEKKKKKQKRKHKSSKTSDSSDAD